MNKDEEVILNTDRKIRNYSLAYLIVGLFSFVGFIFWRHIGLILGFIIGVFVNMTIGSIQGVRLWDLPVQTPERRRPLPGYH